MPQVEALKTPASAADVAGAMSRAYVKLTGNAPPAESSYLMPLAQSALETANWKSLYNFDLGNVTTANPNDSWFFQYQGSLKFKAYASLDDGALAMMSWLQKHGAIAAADANDLNAYGDALQRGCYVGCPWSCGAGISPETCRAKYLAGIASLMHRYAGVVPSAAPTPPSQNNTSALLKGIAIIGAASFFAWALRRR